MAFVYQKTRAEAVCSLEQDVLVLLNDKSRMKGDLHVRFREKFEVKVLLLTRLRGRNFSTMRNSSYSIGILKKINYRWLYMMLNSDILSLRFNYSTDILSDHYGN